MYSPVQTNINDLLEDIGSLYFKLDTLEKLRDYRENTSHSTESKTTHLEAMRQHHWKKTKANLQVFKLPDNLRDEISKRFEWLNDLEKPTIGFQVISGGAFLLPHKDETRKSSIIISVNDNTSISEFYSEKNPEDQMVPHPDNIHWAAGTRMLNGESWLFDNSSVHAVQLNKPVRLNISLGFDKTNFKNLCEYIINYAVDKQKSSQ